MGITPISGIHSTILLIFPLPLIPLNFLYIIRFAAGLHHSSIVGNNLTFLTWLDKWLKPVTNQSSYWNHCYRATVHGFSSSVFHSNCDGKGPSVTIILVGKYIFGGYTRLSWGKRPTVNKNRYIQDLYICISLSYANDALDQSDWS